MSSPDAAAGPPPTPVQEEEARKVKRQKLVIDSPSSSSSSSSDEEDVCVIVDTRTIMQQNGVTASAPLEIDDGDDSDIENRKKGENHEQIQSRSQVQRTAQNVKRSSPQKKKKASQGTESIPERKQSAEESRKVPASKYTLQSTKRDNKSTKQVVDLTENEVLDLTKDDEPLKFGDWKKRKVQSSAACRKSPHAATKDATASSPPAPSERTANSKSPPTPRNAFKVLLGAAARKTSQPFLLKKPPPPAKKSSSTPFENVARRPPPIFLEDDSSDDELIDSSADEFTRKNHQGKSTGDLDMDDRKPAAKPRIDSSAACAPTSKPVAAQHPAAKPKARNLCSLSLPKHRPGNHQCNGKREKSQSEEKAGATVDLLSDSDDEDTTDEEEVVDEFGASEPQAHQPTQTNRVSDEYMDPDRAAQHEASVIASENDPPYTWDEFQDMFCKVENQMRVTMYEIENSKGVTEANHNVDKKDSDSQRAAMYGTVLPEMTMNIAEYSGLTKDMTFIDIGSGVGNNCFQLAFTLGCNVKGIEMVESRNFIAEQFLPELMHLHNLNFNPGNKNRKKRRIGEMEFRRGCMEAPENRSFILDDTDVALCNNAHGVFGHRSELKRNCYSLNHYLVGLFCLMKCGATLLTLDKLPDLLSCKAVYDRRCLHKLTKKGEKEEDCSFFTEDHKSFYGKDLVSWTSDPSKKVTVYKYVKTQGEDATFLCSNPACEYAQKSIAIPAWIEVNGRPVLNRCECGHMVAQKRDRKKPELYEAKG